MFVLPTIIPEITSLRVSAGDKHRKSMGRAYKNLRVLKVKQVGRLWVFYLTAINLISWAYNLIMEFEWSGSLFVAFSNCFQLNKAQLVFIWRRKKRLKTAAQFVLFSVRALESEAHKSFQVENDLRNNKTNKSFLKFQLNTTRTNTYSF